MYLEAFKYKVLTYIVGAIQPVYASIFATIPSGLIVFTQFNVIFEVRPV
jgi:hypothetical protein